jgi:peptidoglycan/LPS O-acetylase OafA/YrhL
MTEAVILKPAEPPHVDVRAERVYFPELDGLRFVAFALVYLFHGGIPGDLLASLVGRAAGRALRENGWVGVQLFFILSGYLITTLLLREEAEYGRVDLRSFWVRRVLRIWPLYYLTVAIGFFVIPWFEGAVGSPGYRGLLTTHLPAFLAFLGNWSMALVRPVPYDNLSILWSVCVEEQFYLIVPLLVAWVGRRYRLGLVAALMAATVAARWRFAVAYPNELMIRFNTFLMLDTLLGGVLLALVLGPAPRASRWARWGQWPLALGTVWLFAHTQLAAGTTWKRTWEFVWIWVWGVALVATLVSSRGWLRAALSYSRLVWLGKISYGLYMYHEVALWLRRRMETRLPWFPNKQVLLTIAALAATIALAALSYYAYERRFLALKRRWTRVPSRPV